MSNKELFTIMLKNTKTYIMNNKSYNGVSEKSFP